MALRKAYEETIKEKELFDSEVLDAKVSIVPFVFGIDNGIVKIEQQDSKGVKYNAYLSYDMIARLYGVVFPSKTFICNEEGCAIEIPNHGTLKLEEKMIMWERFPDTRPSNYPFNIIEEVMKELQK